MSVQRSVSLPLPARLLLLSVSFFLFLILNAVGVGAQTVTPLPLGSSVAGRIDPNDEVDIYKLDLSGRLGITDVWIYSTGELDTIGGLFDSAANPLAVSDDSYIEGRWTNFHLRANLVPRIYYVAVSSYDDAIGDYVVHAVTVTDPGNTIGTAKTLNLSAPTAGSIGFAGDNDYFRLDLAKSTHLYLYVRSVYGERVAGYPVDSGNIFVPSNVHIRGDGFFIRDYFAPGTHYIRVLTLNSVTSHPVPYTIHAFEETDYPAFLEDCQTKTDALNNPQISDSLYGCQWHLQHHSGEGINVEPVWAEGITGEGINIAVVDDGMDFNHEDLRDNVNTSLNHDYTDIGSIFNPFAHHGTYMAGIIAARDNDVGVRGVAPRATIYGYNYLAGQTFLNEANAMTRNMGVTAVSNNSWGPIGGPGLGHANAFWELAVESGASNGYGGNGTFYAFAGGNGYQEGGHSNLNEYANHYAVTAVCGTNDIGTRRVSSEFGANLWVCAPAGDYEDAQIGIVTTENYDRYIYGLRGTSVSTAIVSGVAALMRQANPNLTWRDLKLILAASARKNDPTNAGWKDGPRKYTSTSATDRYHFNHEYGFGVVDAEAAVDMAKSWSSNLPPLKSFTAASGNLNALIPDAPILGDPTTITQTLTLNTDINFTEFVEVTISLRHRSFRDVEIELESPSRAVSKLAVPFDAFGDDDPDTGFISLQGAFRFGSARHLGEDPNGTWKLRVTDSIPIVGGTFDSWDIKVYGHSGTPASTSVCATGTAVTNASGNPGLVSDCETLLEARDTLVGTGTSMNWSVNTPITSWDGITVEGTPARVTQLLLWNRGLRGTIPEQMESLTALKKLDLGTALEVCVGDVCRDVEEHERNRLTGTIPATLGNLAGLESLLLNRNQLTGAIPAQLGSLSNLQVLSLWENQFTGTIPVSLGNLPNLEQLYLSQNQLTGAIPTQLGNLSNLQELYLGENQLSGQIPTQLRQPLQFDTAVTL